VLLLAGLTKLLDSAGFMGAVAASFLQPLLVTVQGYHANPRVMTWRPGSVPSTPPCSSPSWSRPPEADTEGK